MTVLNPPLLHPLKGEHCVNDESWGTNTSQHPLFGHRQIPQHQPLSLQPQPPLARRQARPRARTQNQASAPIEEEKHWIAFVYGSDGRIYAKSSPSLRHLKKRYLQPISDDILDAIKCSETNSQAESRTDQTGSEAFHEQNVSLTQPGVGTISYLYPDRRAPKRARANTDSRSASHSMERGCKNARVDDDGIAKTISFELQDEARVLKWTMEAFEAVQQITCRLIAKLWIKIIEPKKQSAHPYNGGLPKSAPKDPERTKPPYWPAEVPHREPDHIQKQQRIVLLTHLVRNAPYEPLAPNKLGEKVTIEELQAQTAERKNEIPEKKYQILQDIFRVWRYVELYKDNSYDGSTVMTVLDCSKTGSVDQGEQEEETEDADEKASHISQGAEEDTEEIGTVEQAEQTEVAPLTPTSSSMQSPGGQQRMQAQAVTLASACSSFSARASDIPTPHQQIPEQTRHYSNSFERSMGGEVIERSATNGATYNLHDFSQSTYAQIPMVHPRHQQPTMQTPMQHNGAAPWGEYDNPDAFSHVSHMGAPVQAEPVMTNYGMFGGAHIGSMPTAALDIPCSEDPYQQLRFEQMQRQYHDLVPELTSQPLREMPYRTTSTQSAQQMTMNRHHSYDGAMLQSSYF